MTLFSGVVHPNNIERKNEAVALIPARSRESKTRMFPVGLEQ